MHVSNMNFFVFLMIIQSTALHQCRRIIQFCTFHYFFLAGQRIHQALLCGIQPLPYLLGLIPVLLISGVLYGFTRFTNHNWHRPVSDNKPRTYKPLPKNSIYSSYIKQKGDAHTFIEHHPNSFLLYHYLLPLT